MLGEHTVGGIVRFGFEAAVLGEHSVHCGTKFWMANGFSLACSEAVGVLGEHTPCAGGASGGIVDAVLKPLCWVSTVCIVEPIKLPEPAAMARHITQHGGFKSRRVLPQVEGGPSPPGLRVAWEEEDLDGAADTLSLQNPLHMRHHECRSRGNGEAVSRSTRLPVVG